ncbi:MAG TPA: low molecular weight phosphotyrosine protein phosphatase, partial [Actinotalea sp.]|nr:low molecular weight phosphotyrosine protein phosphatase [Actinotalea sp.]
VDRDLVLAMTARHAGALRALGHGDVRMYRAFDPSVGAGPAEHLDVADPWYGDEADFEVALAVIEAAADGVVAHVRAALGSR